MYTVCKVHLYVVCVCVSPQAPLLFLKLAVMSHVVVYRPALLVLFGGYKFHNLFNKFFFT